MWHIGGEFCTVEMTILGSSQFFAGLDAPMDALPCNTAKLRIWLQKPNPLATLLSVARYCTIDNDVSHFCRTIARSCKDFCSTNSDTHHTCSKIAVRYFVLGKKTGVIGSIIKQRDQRRV